MKIFNKIVLLLVFILLLSLNLEAKKSRGEYSTKNIIGQNYYLKNCSSCHGEGNRGGNMASIKEWELFFTNEAKELIYFHEDDDSTRGVIGYLRSSDFKKQSKLMLKFLQEFAYDSENVPTCN